MTQQPHRRPPRRRRRPAPRRAVPTCDRQLLFDMVPPKVALPIACDTSTPMTMPIAAMTLMMTVIPMSRRFTLVTLTAFRNSLFESPEIDAAVPIDEGELHLPTLKELRYKVTSVRIITTKSLNPKSPSPTTHTGNIRTSGIARPMGPAEMSCSRSRLFRNSGPWVTKAPRRSTSRSTRSSQWAS